MGQFKNNPVNNNIDLVNDTFINAQAAYIRQFGILPNISTIYDVDIEKMAVKIEAELKDEITQVFRDLEYNSKKKKYDYDEVIYMLTNNRMIFMASSYMELFYADDTAFIQRFTEVAAKTRRRAKRQPHEINLVTAKKGSFGLTSMEIKRTKLDLDLCYEDDFKEIDNLIQERLKKDKDKGIVLLHGLPGTGKTTYLRYLIGKLKKRVLFISSEMATNIIEPGFMELLIQNPNSILVIEDAENVILDRKISGNAAVANLLNLSDGLLSDCLNIQLVCSFNSELSAIDSALLRKGRLIARYEFGKLSVEKSQRLSDSLGHKRVITQPMSIAEITNPNEITHQPKKTVIGFRRVMEEDLVN
ncbi:AAA family ATPase [Chitinophaga sp. Cy-1792]|uniref:AAA family ATPase n=1 Tax=Chitinophaga sp. Cy-1792 TaxID=2608339 RepID=UPI001421D9B8|nr:AAA family ATPase [Chitinophaga sp. Cy-1792]